jgi:hypothetical protein
MSDVQPPSSDPPLPDPVAPTGTDRGAIGSLFLAFLAPISIGITGPIGMFTMLLTASPSAHTRLTWLAPVFFWSLPLLMGISSVSLARSSLRKCPRGSGGWVVALISLSFMGIFLLVGLIATLHFMVGARFFDESLRRS